MPDADALAILHVPFCLAPPGNGADMTLNAPFAGHAPVLLAAHSCGGQNLVFATLKLSVGALSKCLPVERTCLLSYLLLPGIV